jgi:hypothetical protein
MYLVPLFPVILHHSATYSPTRLLRCIWSTRTAGRLSVEASPSHNLDSNRMDLVHRGIFTEH